MRQTRPIDTVSIVLPFVLGVAGYLTASGPVLWLALASAKHESNTPPAEYQR